MHHIRIPCEAVCLHPTGYENMNGKSCEDVGSGVCVCVYMLALPQCPWGLFEGEGGQRGHIDRNGDNCPWQCLSLEGPSDH